METIGEVARQRLTSLPLVAPGRGNESREGGGGVGNKNPLAGGRPPAGTVPFEMPSPVLFFFVLAFFRGCLKC